MARGARGGNVRVSGESTTESTLGLARERGSRSKSAKPRNRGAQLTLSRSIVQFASRFGCVIPRNLVTRNDTFADVFTNS